MRDKDCNIGGGVPTVGTCHWQMGWQVMERTGSCSNTVCGHSQRQTKSNDWRVGALSGDPRLSASVRETQWPERHSGLRDIVAWETLWSERQWHWPSCKLPWIVRTVTEFPGNSRHKWRQLGQTHCSHVMLGSAHLMAVLVVKFN